MRAYPDGRLLVPKLCVVRSYFVLPVLLSERLVFQPGSSTFYGWEPLVDTVAGSSKTGSRCLGCSLLPLEHRIIFYFQFRVVFVIVNFFLLFEGALKRFLFPSWVFGPVSYTHLDVYKRQTLEQVARF